MPLRARLAALLAAGLLLLTGCTAAPAEPDGGDGGTAPDGGTAAPRLDTTLRVIAGSEVKDMQPILDDLAAETGVVLDIEYQGTLKGTKAVVDPANAESWDLAWFPSARYLSLLPEGPDTVAASESIMRSPVVLGVKAPVADALGWTEAAPPTWQGIVEAIDAGSLRYGMTNPASSNSGFTTLLQAATALSGTGTVLEEQQLAQVAPQLERFASGQALTSGSSGWLLDAFIADPASVDGVFNYESVLRGVEVDGEPLRLLVPSDGVITSDYPLVLLDGADASTREAYDRVVDYLLRDDVQQRIADETHRRTSATPRDVDASVFELPFPAKESTVNALLTDWLSTLKKPSSMVFAVDTSGSMADDGRDERLRDALRRLVGDGSEAGAGFIELRPRERISLVEFAERVKSERTVDIPTDPAARGAALDELHEAIDALAPAGDTAIYDTAAHALETAASGESGAITSVVLFTDGENTVGRGQAEFAAWYDGFTAAHPELGRLPVHVIVFGEADAAAMAELAALTGGASFDARTADLGDVFEEIRGYL